MPALRSIGGRLYYYALCCAFSVVSTITGAIAQNNVIWERIGADLEVAQASVRSNALFSSELILFRTSARSIRIGVIRASDYGANRSSVKSLANSAHALLAINANYFDQEGHPLGLVVSRGIQSQQMHKGGGTLSAVFAVYKDYAKIVQRSDYKSEGVIEAIQAGPRLISNGAKVKGLRDTTSNERRSGVCIDQSGNVIIYCVSSGILGVSIEELQTLLISNDIACAEALNLDGGGSAQLYFDAPQNSTMSNIEEVYIQGRDPVPVALGLFARENKP